MVDCLDVAAYILRKAGEITPSKLQRLVYYSQAWSLVWDKTPLFQDSLLALDNGPTISKLYELHKGQFKVSSAPGGTADTLSPAEKETVDEVLKAYGPLTSWELSRLACGEPPWKIARKENQEISLQGMAEYYGSLED